MKVSYVFKDNKELLEFITWEVKKYTGCSDLTKVLYSYNRLTVEELAQEVFLKLLRTVSGKGFNKSYVRQAVVFVCIDEYRRYRLVDPQVSKSSSVEDEEVTEFDKANTLETTEQESFGLTERIRHLDIFKGRELEIVLLLMEGYRNPEVREILKIPKMSYYTALKKIKMKYIEELNTEGEQALISLFK